MMLVVLEKKTLYFFVQHEEEEQLLCVHMIKMSVLYALMVSIISVLYNVEYL